tara:strand:- start:1341 stop:2120 length:780 start_codon:yes stop_codon:yes gene_type:complete
LINKYWLEAKNITAIKNDYKVVNNLSLKIKNKEKVLILGPNGSGKSSIVDLINRNIYPIEKKDSTFKLFDQRLINIWDLRQRISTVNNDVRLRVNQNLSVIEIIISGLYGKFCKIKNIKNKDINTAKNLIKKISLKEISYKKFINLSDGEKQITLIARAIINNPKILILDEPSNNLDIRSKIFLINKIRELSRYGTNILCITHDIDMITNDYNRIILLKNRKIIADDKPELIMKSKNINKLFDIKIKLSKHKTNWSISR